MQVISSNDVELMEMLISRHQSIFSHLYKRSSEDQAYDVSNFDLASRVPAEMQKSAMDLTAATWGQELAVALRQLDLQQKDSDALRSEQAHLYTRMKSTLRKVWKDSSNDVFDIG